MYLRKTSVKGKGGIRSDLRGGKKVRNETAKQLNKYFTILELVLMLNSDCNIFEIITNISFEVNFWWARVYLWQWNLTFYYLKRSSINVTYESYHGLLTISTTAQNSSNLVRSSSIFSSS